ncbi:MAG: UTP--glucose-1-phosphate uridylyltransferase, partial [Verrucomicrobiota bacterium]
STHVKNCAEQLIETALAARCSVSAVQATHESKLPNYGAIGGHLQPGQQRVYRVESVIEKPTPTEAEQRLIVPGLRAGHYLCFFGMHVLTPRIMEILSAHLAQAPAGSKIQLSPALAELASKEQYLALEVQGRRYDLDEKYGLFTTQLALALVGNEREEVLAQLVGLLAQQNLTPR